MTVARMGLWGGLAAFLLMLLLPPPEGMSTGAWHTAALVVLMASWWMTQALPLTATAFLPFLAFPLMGVMDAGDTAAAYYSPIMFLFLGGSMIALAIERTGLHRRFAFAIVSRGGSSPASLLFAFMLATALLSMIASNTATTLIMIPMALGVLRACDCPEGKADGFPGALVMGIAFAATIGGLGTLVGSPTNAIAAGIIERTIGLRIDFLTWASYGLPLVALTLPLCWFILLRVQRVGHDGFDTSGARSGIGAIGEWTQPERRLVPILALTFCGWIFFPLVAPDLTDAVTDGSIALAATLLLFVVPDGSGRPILTWAEANRAPWDVILMFGGGLALAAGVSSSGLAEWIGATLRPFSDVPPILVAVMIVLIVTIVTEFASNVGAASGMIPVVAGLVVALGTDPILLALPAAFAASWGFMLPSGTGPNAIAWGTGHVALPRMLKAGLLLDLAGIPLLVGTVWLIAAIMP